MTPKKPGISRRQFIVSTAAIAGASLATGLSPRRAQAALSKVIKIGCQGVISGPLGSNGDFMRKGAMMAVDEINSAGGIGGSRLELEFRDDEAKIDVATKNARYFVDTWGADFLMGIDSSGVALGLGQLMPEFDKILIVTHGSTNRYNEELVYAKGIRQLFRTSVPLYQDSIAGALVAKDFPVKRWAGILPDYEYGYSSWKLFKHTLKKLRPDVEFVEESFAKSGTVDFSSHIARVMAKEPEAIFSVEWAGELVALIKQCKQFGVYGKIKHWMAGMGGTIDVLEGLGKDYPEGLWGTTRFWFDYPKSPETVRFVADYRKRYNSYPSHNAECAYAAVKLIKQAVDNAQTLNTKDLILAMEGMELKRPAGPCYIRKEDHQAIYNVPWGQVHHDPAYPMPVLTNLKLFPASEYYRSPPFPPVA